MHKKYKIKEATNMRTLFSMMDILYEMEKNPLNYKNRSGRWKR